jgi:transposase InsO family protein
VKRRQGVCGPEQACERESIAPQAIVVEEADLVPQKGRHYRHKRYRVSVGGLFRGSDPQHADHGTFVDWGDPTASEAAYQLDRYR